jgi:hypothetical protein
MISLVIFSIVNLACYEDTNYERLISYLKKQYPSVYDLRFLQEKYASTAKA